MNLAPLALSLALLFFWLGLGWSLIAVLEPRFKAFDAFLVAPLCGVATTLLPVFWLSALGMPVASFARPLLVALLTCIALGWIWQRPDWTRHNWIFVAPVVVALVVIGFPTFGFGFDWVANANDDWANYNLSATRYLNSGLYQRPSLEALRAGSDYPGYFWFLEVAGDGRPGADMLLAWVSAVTGQNPFFIFMPVILAFHGVLSLSAAALASRSLGRGPALFVGLVLTALAPLNLYAVHQQLIAQVIGLAFMCGISTLSFVAMSELTTVRRLAFVTIVAAAYAIVYPETVPFFGLSFIVFHILHARVDAWGWRRAWRLAAIAVGLVLMLGPYLVSFGYFVLSQFSGSSVQGNYNGVSLFPYFVVPSGLSVLFGFSTLGTEQSGWALSIGIAAGLALSVLVVVATFLGLWRRSAIGAYLLTILMVCILLARGRNDFGLFKLAMFAQPFIWFALIAILLIVRRRWAWAVLGLVSAAMMISDVRYTQSAVIEALGSGGGLPGASQARLLHKLLTGAEVMGCDVNVLTPLPPLAKILADVPGCSRAFVDRDFFDVSRATVEIAAKNPLHHYNGVLDFTEKAYEGLQHASVTLRFKTIEGRPFLATTTRPKHEYGETLQAPSFDTVVSGVLISKTGGKTSLSNIDSDIGVNYYIAQGNPVSIYADEKDVYDQSKAFAAIGRFLLFRVEAPPKKMRLQLSLTTTLMRDKEEKLPPAIVMGASAVSVGLLGHGSARVVSPAFSPLTVDGIAYVLLDLGADPKLLPTPRTGLMRLYGTHVAIDYRQLVAFARQIRFLDADIDQSPDAPSSVSRLPQDLYNQALQYSGLYEDGWMGDDGFFLLHSSRPGVVVLRGEMPVGIGVDTVDLDVSVDGSAPVHKSLTPGAFAVQVPVAAGSKRIDFHFSKLGRLGVGDDRPVSAKFSSIAIEANPEGGAAINPDPNTPEILRRVGLNSDGVFQDGWLAPKGFFQVRADRDSDIVLHGTVPGGLGLEEQHIDFQDGVDPSLGRDLRAGAFEIVVPVKAGVTNLAFSFSKSAVLPSSDGRRIGALLTAVSVEPQRQSEADPDLHP